MTRFTEIGRGERVVVDRTLIVTFIAYADADRRAAIVETGHGSMVVDVTRLSHEREEVDE